MLSVIMIPIYCISILYAMINSWNIIMVKGSPHIIEQVNSDVCPLWHLVDEASGRCKCCDTQTYVGIFRCNPNEVEMLRGYCMTWNNATQDVEVGRCPQIYQDHQDPHYKSTYSIPTDLSGSELNSFICSDINRKGAQCRECIDGYGPAVFSDGITCADCSKHKYHWILYFIFQLTMVIIMYLVMILLWIC